MRNFKIFGRNIYRKKKKKITSFLKFTQISIFLQKRMNRYIFYLWDLTRKRIIFRIEERLNFYRDDILNFTIAQLKFTRVENTSRIDLYEHNLSIIISYIRFVDQRRRILFQCVKKKGKKKKKKGTKFSVDSWGEKGGKDDRKNGVDAKSERREEAKINNPNRSMYASFIVFIQRPRVSNDVTLTNTQVEIIPVICHGSSMFSNGQLNGGANSQLISKLLRGRWIRWRVAISHRFAICARNSGRKIKKEFRGYWRIFNGNSVEIRSIFFYERVNFH